MSVIALVSTRQPRKGAAIAGLVLCAVAVVLGLIRLAAGGGIL